MVDGCGVTRQLGRSFLFVHQGANGRLGALLRPEEVGTGGPGRVGQLQDGGRGRHLLVAQAAGGVVHRL